MAGKKPAKVNASNKKEVVILPGKAVYYMGSKNTEAFSCPSCNRKFLKGMLYEYESSSYCSRGCIPREEKLSV